MSSFLNGLASLTEELNITYCDPGDAVSFTFFYVWFIAIFFCIFFIVVQKRSQHCLGCCFGRPGLPVPINFLVSPRNRSIYVILFGVMGFSLVNGFSNLDVNIPSDNIYLSLFNKIMWAPFITVATLVLQYFPLFTAVEFPHPRIGYVTGLIYSIIWYLFEWIPRFLVYRNYTATCGSSVSDITTIIITVFQDGPLIIMEFSIVIWFFYMTGFYCFWKPFHKKRTFAELGDLDDPGKGIRHYHLDHVKNLLKREVKETPTKPSIVKSVIMYLFPFKRNYKLPVPLLGAITAMVMIIYQTTFALIISTLTSLITLSDNYNNLLRPIILSYKLVTIDRILGAAFIGLPTIMVLAAIFALLLSVFLLLHMIASISKKIKEVAKHGFEGRLPPRFRRLAAYWSYLGSQIGLFTIAWFFYFIIFLLVGIVLLVVILLLLISSATRSIAVSVILTIGVPLVWSRLLSIGQNLVSRFVFLEDRKEESKFIPVQHKRLYNLFGFVLFFYNGFAGIVGAIIRIVINIMFGILLLFRLDIQFLPSHLFRWDFGHKSFLGFIYMDYCYNNAVMHVFSHLMENSAKRSLAKQRHFTGSKVELVEADILADIIEVKPQNKGARNRWFVAYTLIRNPCLQKYTANNIALLENEKELQEEKVYLLEHTIKNVKKDKKKLEQGKAKQEMIEEKEKLAVEKSIGEELKPRSDPGENSKAKQETVEEEKKLPLEELIGEELKPRSDPGENSEAAHIYPTNFNVPYYLMKTPHNLDSIPATEDTKEQND